MRKKLDIKKLGIPNVCFSIETKGTKKFSRQRIKNGFDESETWFLGYTIAKFIIPRLSLLIEKQLEMFDEPYQGFILDCTNFIKAMELIIKNHGAQILTHEESEFVNDSLKLFHKIFPYLWW